MVFRKKRFKYPFPALTWVCLASIFWLWDGDTHFDVRSADAESGRTTDATEFNPPLGRYHYKITWANLEAAEAFLTIDREGDYYRITADTQTTKSIEFFYSVRYRGEGVIRAEDYRAVKTVLVNQTRYRETRTEIIYHDGGEIESTKVKKRKRKPEKVKVRKLDSDTGVLDVFSAVFLTRSFDWQVGLYEEFDVYTGGKQPYRVTLNCVDIAPLMHRDKEVGCWVVVPTFTDLTKPDENKTISRTQIYLSADPSRDILKIKTQTAVGAVRARMVSFEPQ